MTKKENADLKRALRSVAKKDRDGNLCWCPMGPNIYAHTMECYAANAILARKKRTRKKSK